MASTELVETDESAAGVVPVEVQRIGGATRRNRQDTEVLIVPVPRIEDVNAAVGGTTEGGQRSLTFRVLVVEGR